MVRVKKSYGLPVSLDRSWLDHEIILSGSMPSVPVKVLLFHVGGVLLLFWAAAKTPVAGAGFGWILLFVLTWLVAQLYFGRYTKTKELVISRVPAMAAYAPPSSRQVRTRSDSDVTGFYSIVGIKEVEDSGLIKFADGYVGKAYQVVGSASTLLFDDDRDRILMRVDAFWRKVDPSSEWVFLTTKEPLRVTRQTANLWRANKALRDKGLLTSEIQELFDEDYDILTNFVGGKFRSIHQYLVIKTTGIEHLQAAEAVLNEEVRSSRMMFKSCMMLSGSEFVNVMKTFYQGRVDLVSDKLLHPQAVTSGERI